MKLRNKILAFALPLTLIPFVLTALAVYYFVVRSFQVQIEDEQNKLLAEAIVDIRREQEAARRDVALIANLPVIAEYLEAISQGYKPLPEGIQTREAAARASLQLFFDQNPYYLQLNLVDAQGKSESSSANCRNQTCSSRSRTKICSEECLLPGMWTRKFKCRWKLFGPTNSLRCLPGGFDERNSPAWLSSI